MKLRNKDNRTAGPGSGSSAARTTTTSRAKGATGAKRKYTNKASAFNDEDVIQEADYTYDADVPDASSKRAMLIKQDEDEDDNSDEIIEVNGDSFPTARRGNSG